MSSKVTWFYEKREQAIERHLCSATVSETRRKEKLNDILNGVQRDFKDPQDMKKGNSGHYLEDIQ